MFAVDRSSFFRHGVITDQDTIKLQCVGLCAFHVLEVIERQRSFRFIVGQFAVRGQILAALITHLEGQDTLGFLFRHVALDGLREFKIAGLHTVVVLEGNRRELIALHSSGDIFAFLDALCSAAVQLVSDCHMFAVDRRCLLSHHVLADQDLLKCQLIFLRALCVREVLERERSFLDILGQSAVCLQVLSTLIPDKECQCAFSFLLSHIALDRLRQLEVALVFTVVIFEGNCRRLIRKNLRFDIGAFIHLDGLASVKLIAYRHVLAVDRCSLLRHKVIADENILDCELVAVRTLGVLEVLERQCAISLILCQRSVRHDVLAVFIRDDKCQRTFRLFLCHSTLDGLCQLEVTLLIAVVIRKGELRCLLVLHESIHALTGPGLCLFAAIELIAHGNVLATNRSRLFCHRVFADQKILEEQSVDLAVLRVCEVLKRQRAFDIVLCQRPIRHDVLAVFIRDGKCQRTFRFFFRHITFDGLRQLEVALLCAVIILECQRRCVIVLNLNRHRRASFCRGSIAAIQLVAD